MSPRSCSSAGSRRGWCASQKPKDDSRVERPIPYIRDSLFAGRYFTVLAQMQAEALRWAREVYGVHKHRGLDGQTPRSMISPSVRGRLVSCSRGAGAWCGGAWSGVANFTCEFGFSYFD
jgi:hypothetical protein